MAIPLSLSEVPNATPYVQYVATHGQTVYPYPFPITQDSDLIVVYNGVTLATDAGYALSGQGDDTGGNATFTAGASAGDIVTLYRDIAIQRLTQIGQNSGFSSSAFNAEYNNIYLIMQQLEASIAQCLQVPNTNYPTPATTLVPGTYANKYLAFDQYGNPTPAQLTTSGSLTQSLIGTLLYTGQTAAELAKNVTPVNPYYPECTLLRYGADPAGAVDATQALINACAVAAQKGNAQVSVGIAGAKFKVYGAWTADLNTTGIDFQGAWIDASGFVTGAWFTPTQSAADLDARPFLSQAHPIRNVVIVGPGATNAVAQAVWLNDTTAPTPLIAGCTFENVSFVNWGQDVLFGEGSVGNTFSRCQFGVFSGGGGYASTTYSIKNPSGLTNAGERNTFFQCAWYNKNFIITQENDADTYFIGCSLDGAKQAVDCEGGQIVLVGCHIESGVTNVDGNYWISCTGTNSAVTMKGCQFVCDFTKSVYAPCYSDVSCTNGGIFLDDCTWGSGTESVTTYMIAGAGNARVRNLMFANSGTQLTLAASLNRLAYGGFESANYASDGWTLSGGAARATTYAHSGTYSLCMPGVNGTPSIALFNGKCEPGQYVILDVWYKFPSTAAASFSGNFNWADGGGNTLGSPSNFISTTSAVGNWTFVHFKSTTPAPLGAQGYQFQFEVSGVASGTQTAAIDDLLLTIPD